MDILGNLFDGLGSTAIILVALIVLFIEMKNMKSEMKDMRAELKGEIRDLRVEVKMNSQKLQDLAERVSHQEGVELERRYSRVPEAVAV